jgi:hypothetical protein
MCAGFDDLQPVDVCATGFKSPILDFKLEKPFSKLKRQQFAEQRAYADVRKKIAAFPSCVLFLFVISTKRTIERQFHETRELDRAVFVNFYADLFGGGVQGLRVVWI